MQAKGKWLAKLAPYQSNANWQSYKIQLATFGRRENGSMAEEHLFGHNKEFLKQLGVGQ